MRALGVLLLACAAGARGAALDPGVGDDDDIYHGPALRVAHQPSALRVPHPEWDVAHWRARASTHLRARRRLAPAAASPARRVVLFVGDGMSLPTLVAARILSGQRANRTGEESTLAMETFPTLGLVKTYCVNAQIPDSACTATAYLRGVKTNQGLLGLTAAVPRRDCAASLDPDTHVDSIAAWALADGRDAGLVTTARVTHASPAATYARAANRLWESDARVRLDDVDPARCPDIAHQLVHASPGKHFKVILGGGRREFLPNDTLDEENFHGRRLDGRNLIEEWQLDKENQGLSHKYIWNRSSLLALSHSPPEYLLGLFESSHLQYHLESNLTTEPTLAELTEVAIHSLNRNKKGFFLFVEGGRIDHAHHDSIPHLALDETLELDAAVVRAMELLDERDSLLVVTADHAHVMTVNGYTHRGGDILGPSDDLDSNGVPYMTLSYGTGPGSRACTKRIRPNITAENNFRDIRWQTHADVPLEKETHGGDDVAVFARGPHHALFSGLYEQSHLPHIMAYAACIGPGLTLCNSTSQTFASIFTITFSYVILKQNILFWLYTFV